MYKVLPLFILLLISPFAVSAHPGGLDGQGGHHCRTDCEDWGMKQGEYHFHDDNDNPVPTYENNEDIYDKSLAESLHGRILLQTDQHGEAWYIRDAGSKRYYMKDGATAYQMMRDFGLGISNANLEQIPFVEDTEMMNSVESICQSNPAANQLRGKILLQVEEHGEAWYVDPEKCHRIYMKDGEAAYEIMRFLGLGITDADLERIVRGANENL